MYYNIDEESIENPDLLQAFIEVSKKILADIESRVEVIKANIDSIRGKLYIKRSNGIYSRKYSSILAVDSTWTVPSLELVAGTIAVIISGYVIAAPPYLGDCGVTYVIHRENAGELSGRFQLEVELDSKLLELITAYGKLDESIDMVMIDGSLFFFTIRDFYDPAKSIDLLADRSRLRGGRLASLVSRALVELLGKSSKLNIPVVGVVKRVSSRFLLPRIFNTWSLDSKLLNINDKLLSSLILKPGEYIVMDSFYKALIEYLELIKGLNRRVSSIIDIVRICDNPPTGTYMEKLCNYMNNTAIVYYKQRGSQIFQQTTRLDIYPRNMVDDVVEYAIENSTQNSVPAPIDYIDRYIRLETTMLKKLYTILRSETKTVELETALGLTNPQKHYLWEK
ncbi:MAG: DNA double-strand break repair nuclease NurA [Acidilobaceae archaeon]